MDEIHSPWCGLFLTGIYKKYKFREKLYFYLNYKT